jgi:hypothetical protein
MTSPIGLTPARSSIIVVGLVIVLQFVCAQTLRADDGLSPLALFIAYCINERAAATARGDPALSVHGMVVRWREPDRSDGAR